MNQWPWFAHLLMLLLLPFILVGIINRTKAIWAGRKGPKLYQSFFDCMRLTRKHIVYSVTTSPLFMFAPCILLATTIVAGLLVPIFPGFAPLSFEGDFVAFAYLIALGRVFLMLAALDTGSAFEGMGASRDAAFATFAEPMFFLALGTLAAFSGHSSFQSILGLASGDAFGPFVKVALAVAFFVILQIETARIPTDDPTTHLELTMVHEVMVLDHSGPDLAAISYAGFVKIGIFAALISSALNPFRLFQNPAATIATSCFLMIAVAVAVGLFESLVARFKLSAVPKYSLFGFAAAAGVLILTALRGSLSP